MRSRYMHGMAKRMNEGRIIDRLYKFCIESLYVHMGYNRWVRK